MATLPMPWGKLAYTDTGDEGTPLLLLHGTFCDAEDWAETVAALPPGTRVVNLEFRGHGDSDVPAAPFSMEDLAGDVLALAAHLALPRVILVGHSLGGMVAMLAAARSSRVAGLVLLEGWTNRHAAGAYCGERLYGQLNAPAIARIEEKCASYLARFAPAVWDAFKETVMAFNAYDYLRQAAIPIFEVYGALGKTDGIEARLHLPDNPAIRVEWIPGAGHYLPHERPGEVAAVCARAVETLLAHPTGRQGR